MGIDQIVGRCLENGISDREIKIMIEDYTKKKIKEIMYDNDLIGKLRYTSGNAESRRLIMDKFESYEKNI